MLRVFIGEPSGAVEATTVAVIEANIDDASPQVLGYAMERLLEAGALDATLEPLEMKKGRPGHAAARDRDTRAAQGAADIIFRETTTLGLRIYTAERRRAGAPLGGGRNAARQSAHQSLRALLRARVRRLPRARPRDRRAAERHHRRSQLRVSEKLPMKYYLTTPIYYVNAAPHIGHTYTTIAADTIKRFKRMQGFDPVVLTTGTDEHGQKVERAAKAAGKSPEEFTTAVAAEFRKQWDEFGLQYDHFIRTTDPRHHETVRWLFERCLKNGYIYKGSYTGQYCVFDELYVNDAKPGDPCPDCGRPTETVTEENYFFKLSAFTERLLEAVRRASGFHPAGFAAQRSDLVRQAGAERSFDHAHDYQVGHSGSRRRPPRLLCLVRRADRLHERGAR